MEKKAVKPAATPQPKASANKAAAQHAGMPNMSMVHPAAQPMAQPMSQPMAQPMAQTSTKAMCESHMHRYVEVQAADGHCYDGIVEHVDDEWLCLAVPGAVDQMRGFFPGPFYPPFGGFGPFPFRPRRFNRLVLPLAGLMGLSLLPYYW